MKNIILVSGKQGSGKTTLVREIAERLESASCWSYQMSFAGVLYEMHDKVLEILSDYGIERDTVKDGPLLQVLGTEWGRNTIDQDIWVKTLKGQINRQLKDGNRWYKPEDIYFLVPDCRFKNEFDAFPEALRIRLECSKETRKVRCEMWRDRDDHISETDLDGYADEGRFDLKFNTEEMSVAEIADEVMEVINKRSQG